MTYREQAPPPMLAAWVQCTWQRSGDGGPPVRVVPDGCIDIAWIEGAGTRGNAGASPSRRRRTCCHRIGARYR